VRSASLEENVTKILGIDCSERAMIKGDGERGVELKWEVSARGRGVLVHPLFLKEQVRRGNKGRQGNLRGVESTRRGKLSAGGLWASLGGTTLKNGKGRPAVKGTRR